MNGRRNLLKTKKRKDKNKKRKQLYVGGKIRGWKKQKNNAFLFQTELLPSNNQNDTPPTALILSKNLPRQEEKVKMT